MNADDALRQWLQESGIFGPFPYTYRIQFGAWKEGQRLDHRFLVIQPTGGAPSQLIRTPSYRLLFIGAQNEETAAVKAVADAVVEQMKVSYSFCPITFMEASEPAFFQTTEARPFFEVNVSMILS